MSVCVYREIQSYLYICLYLLDFLGQSKFQRLWIIFTTNILLLVRSSALIFGDEIWSPTYNITTEKSHQRGHCDGGHVVCFSQLEVTIPSISSLLLSHLTVPHLIQTKCHESTFLKNGREVNSPTFHSPPNPLSQDA